MHFVVGAMAHILTWSHKKDGGFHGKLKGADPQTMLECLRRFCGAGLRSPGVSQPERKKR